MLRHLNPVLITLALGGCATTGNPGATLATAQLTAADGRTIGTAAIFRTGAATKVRVSVNGTAGAVHGLHLHTVGKCEAPFTSAGPHLNPGGHQHGADNPMGAHLGDLPNVTIGAQGAGSIEANLGPDAQAIDGALFDADGTSIVLHAAADDYRTDPSGNSGARIACGVLKRV